MVPGAHEPPKATKEHASTTWTRVPSKYEFEAVMISILGKRALISRLRDALHCMSNVCCDIYMASSSW